MGITTGRTDTVPPTNDSVTARRAAFADVFNANYAVILGFISRQVAEPFAEDIAAEVFTRAWESWPNAPAEQKPWLLGIARHLVVDHYRATERGDRLATAIGNQLGPIYDPHTGTDVALDLQRAWAELSTSDREVLALVAWDGLTGEQAASVLNCSRTAFSVRLTRARRRLRALLERQPQGGLAGQTQRRVAVTRGSADSEIHARAIRSLPAQQMSPVLSQSH